MKQKNIFEVIVLGRGGQGAKTTAELLVQAAVRKGKFIQAYPEFGPERSGAPMKTYVRISSEPIRTHEPVTFPSCIIVLDESLLTESEIVAKSDAHTPVIVNTTKTKEQCQTAWGKGHYFVPIDAANIAKEIIGENRPNSVILGTFAFVTERVSVDDICETFTEKYQNKISSEKTEKNVQAIRYAYDHH